MNLKSIVIVSLMAAGLTVTAMAQSEVPSSAAYAFMTADHNMRSSKMIGMPVYKGVHAQPLEIFDCNSQPCVQSFQKSLNLLDAR